MADAMKSDEIEDVLSSIRRLVSDHQPPAQTRAQPPVTSGAAPVQATLGDGDDPAPVPHDSAAPTDRLLLTPALRVTDPEDPWVPITPRAEEEASAAVDDPQEAEIARDDGADWARDLWAEDGLGEEASQPADLTDDAPGHAPGHAPDHTPDPQLQADQWDAGDAALPQDLAATRDDGLSDPVDVTEAVLQEIAQDPVSPAPDAQDEIAEVPLSFIRSTKSVGQYEPEEDNDALMGGDLPAPMLELAEARAAHADTPPDDAPRVKVEIVRAAAPHDAPLAEADDDGPLPGDAATEDEERAVQAVLADPADTPAADDRPDPGDDTPTDFLAPVRDDAAAQGAQPDTVEDLGEAPFTFPDDNDGFVDEEALREIIAEVVREELQGEMGVRITRNVRKLVRREIRLALAAQDIE